MVYVVVIALSTVILSVIVGVVYTVVSGTTNPSIAFLSVASLLIGLLVGLVVDMIIAGAAATEYEQVYSRDLNDIENTGNLDAPFVLGLGDGDTNYYYMIKDEKGNWKMSSMEASKVAVVQIKDNSKPRIIKEATRISNEKVRKKSFSFTPSYKYTMYLPEGFVTSKYPVIVQTNTSQ